MTKRKGKKLSKMRKAGAAGLTAGKWLLEFLGIMLDMMPTIETPYAHARRLDGWPKEISRQRIYGEVKRMENRGWIKKAEKQGKKFIRITEKGHLALLYRRLANINDHGHGKWNGEWWMALYDIPEKGRTERRAICRALCRAGFRYLQKSVYIYPHTLPADLVAYLREAKLMSYIRFVHVDQLDGARSIEKHFHLPRFRRSKM